MSRKFTLLKYVDNIGGQKKYKLVY